MSSDLNKLKAAKGGTATDAVAYTVVSNEMPASQESAPYLGRTQVAGSVVQNDVVAELVAKDCPFGPDTVKLVLNQTGLYLLEQMPKNPRSYNLVFAKVHPAISGTFDSADAAFNTERNEVYVAAVPSNAIRTALAGESPSRKDGNTTKLAIKNVHGPADNTILNGEPFEIIGTGLTVGAGDEHAELQLPKSDEPIAVTLGTQTASDDGCQRIEGRLAQPADACDGARLFLWTHGTNLDSSLKKLQSNKLTILAGSEPGPEPLAQTSDGKCKVMTFKDTAGGSSTDFTLGHEWELGGEGLFDQAHAPEGDWYDADTAHITVDGNEAGLSLEHSEDGTVATVTETGDIPPGTYQNVPFSYPVRRGSETETLTLTIPTLVVA